MNPRHLLLALGVTATLTGLAASEPLPRASPESEGVSSAGIETFVKAADSQIDTLHSFMMIRHGAVIAEGWWSPHTADELHEQGSISKSFASTAIGLAIAEGKLTLDDPVLKFFPDERPPSPNANLKTMRIRDLLTMTTGHDSAPRLSRDSTLEKMFLDQPVPYPPGTHFIYDTTGVYMLSAIIQKVTGQRLLDYLRPRIFEPLGIDDPTWAVSPQGINLGGSGLKIRTEDMAKFGELYLRKGLWNGSRLLPASWVEEATSKQVDTDKAPASANRPDWQQGFGFLFWRSRHNTFRATGANGQFVLVMPDRDVVIVVTAQIPEIQPVVQLVWDHLYPAMLKGPLAPDPASAEELRETLAHLAVHAH